MQILLTGGSGMVGKNILEHERARDHRIAAPSSSELNLLSMASTSAYLSKNKFDLIIHAAGRVGGIQANIANPVGFLLENLDMGRNLIGAAQTIGVPKLINIGSSCMYPKDRDGTLDEDEILSGPLEPTNEGYAIAKITIARLCDYIRKQRPELQYKTIIPCNLYGRYDKFDPKHSHLIPAIIHKVHRAKIEAIDSVDIWGDGTARREFMDARDLADFVFFAIDNFGDLPGTLNVGKGEDRTINEYYRAVADAVGYSGRFEHDLSKPTGMKRKLVSVTRLSRLGWKSTTSLRDGVKNAYQFYLENGGTA